MNIGKKVILFFIFLSLILCSFIFVIVQSRIESTLKYEDKILKTNIKKFQNILNLNSEYLKNIAYDYSNNKSLKEYLLGKSNQFDQNINNNEFMQNLNLSYFVLFDANKKIKTSKAYDLSSDETLSVPEELLDFIKQGKLETYFKNKKNNYMTLSFEKAFFKLEVVKHKEQIIGYIFVARTIDSNFLTTISEVLQDYTTLVSSYENKEFKRLKLSNSDVQYDIKTVSDDYILSFIKLYDVLEKKNFYIQMQHQRDMYKELISQMKFNLYSFLVTFLIIIVIFFTFMNKLVTRRIEYITQKVKEASSNESLQIKLNVSYNDELSYLASKINEMFEVIRAHQHLSLKKERDFLQSVLDTQQNIIMITDGRSIHSTNKKFNEIFDSKESFFDSIALLDKKTKSNLVAVAKRYKNQDKAAKFKVINDHKYFTFDVSKLDIKKYLICMNDVSNLNKRINHLQVKASIDELTGVYNKSTITNIAKSWLMSKDFCFIIFDIDYFKKVNDTYGHYIGDCILRDLSKVIAKEIPDNDILGRFGGEEFILLLNVTKEEYAVKIANRIRLLIEQRQFVYDDKSLEITISMGCSLCSMGESFVDVYKRVDNALYRAKEEGRNKVVLI